MNKYKLSLRIFLLFVIIILGSFIPETFHEFFGDWHCQGRENRVGCLYELATHEPTWHYGFRHWVWCAMGAILFFINIFYLIEENTNESYNNK